MSRDTRNQAVPMTSATSMDALVRRAVRRSNGEAVAVVAALLILPCDGRQQWRQRRQWHESPALWPLWRWLKRRFRAAADPLDARGYADDDDYSDDYPDQPSRRSRADYRDGPPSTQPWLDATARR